MKLAVKSDGILVNNVNWKILEEILWAQPNHCCAVWTIKMFCAILPICRFWHDTCRVTGGICLKMSQKIIHAIQHNVEKLQMDHRHIDIQMSGVLPSLQSIGFIYLFLTEQIIWEILMLYRANIITIRYCTIKNRAGKAGVHTIVDKQR